MILPLKELRARRHMTQADLANALNVSQSSVGMWERGYREPDCDMIAAIADFFGVSTDYLFGREKAHLTEKSPFSANEVKFIKKYRELTDDGKRAVMAVIGQMSFANQRSVLASVF